MGPAADSPWIRRSALLTVSNVAIDSPTGEFAIFGTPSLPAVIGNPGTNLQIQLPHFGAGHPVA